MKPLPFYEVTMRDNALARFQLNKLQIHPNWRLKALTVDENKIHVIFYYTPILLVMFSPLFIEADVISDGA